MMLTDIINNFSTKRVLVLGDIILDQYIWGIVDRISPEAPVPIVVVMEETYRLGGAANSAANICSLGGKVFVVGVVGRDENGIRLLNMLSDIGSDTGGIIQDDNRPTILKTRVIAHHQHVVRIDREIKDEIGAEVKEKVAAVAKREIMSVDAVLISDYDKGVVSRELLTEVITYGKPVVIDPKMRNFWNYTGATAVTPNLKEASTALNMPIVNEEDLMRAGHQIYSKLGLQALLITRGEHGMTLFQAGEKAIHIPSVAKEVFDVTGAGDTAAAVFTLAIASGASFLDAARIANYTAGIVVGEVGTACVTPEKLLSVISQ